jgi:hypothetical protein
LNRVLATIDGFVHVCDADRKLLGLEGFDLETRSLKLKGFHLRCVVRNGYFRVSCISGENQAFWEESHPLPNGPMRLRDSESIQCNRPRRKSTPHIVQNFTPNIPQIDKFEVVTLRIIWHNFLRDIWHNRPTVPTQWTYTSGWRERSRKPDYHNSSEADTDAVKPHTREFGCPCLAADTGSARVGVPVVTISPAASGGLT